MFLKLYTKTHKMSADLNNAERDLDNNIKRIRKELEALVLKDYFDNWPIYSNNENLQQSAKPKQSIYVGPIRNSAAFNGNNYQHDQNAATRFSFPDSSYLNVSQFNQKKASLITAATKRKDVLQQDVATGVWCVNNNVNWNGQANSSKTANQKPPPPTPKPNAEVKTNAAADWPAQLPSESELFPVLRLFGLFRDLHYYINYVYPVTEANNVVTSASISPDATMPKTMCVRRQKDEALHKCYIFLDNLQTRLGVYKELDLVKHSECEDSLNSMRLLLGRLEIFNCTEMDHKLGYFLTADSCIRADRLETLIKLLTNKARECHLNVHVFNWSMESKLQRAQLPLQSATPRDKLAAKLRAVVSECRANGDIDYSPTYVGYANPANTNLPGCTSDFVPSGVSSVNSGMLVNGGWSIYGANSANGGLQYAYNVASGRSATRSVPAYNGNGDLPKVRFGVFGSGMFNGGRPAYGANIPTGVYGYPQYDNGVGATAIDGYVAIGNVQAYAAGYATSGYESAAYTGYVGHSLNAYTVKVASRQITQMMFSVDADGTNQPLRYIGDS